MKAMGDTSDLTLFMSHRDSFIQDCSNVYFPEQTPQYIRTRFREVLEYNTTGGKCSRGLSVLHNVRNFYPEGVPEDLVLSSIKIGWCIEFLQAYFLMLDDIEDHSETRRGKLCWYKKEGVGMVAINDSLMIEMTIFQAIKHLFSTASFYVPLFEAFFETCYITSIGQSMDLSLSIMGQQRPANLNQFTKESYHSLVMMKTCHYTYVLPFLVSHIISCRPLTAEKLQLHIQVLNKIGFLFQIQDDYLDLYGDPAVTGKIGTDIQDGKCSWFAVEILSLLSPEERTVFEESYGLTDQNKVQIIKDIYTKLGMKERYETASASLLQEIREMIQTKHNYPFNNYYHSVLDSLYQRQV